MKVISTFAKLLRLIINFKVFKLLNSFYYQGYLFEIGWICSYEHQKPLTKNGEPLPWVTYSFIDFIVGRLDNSMLLFEYGSGNSTLFYSKYVKRVISVEHDMEWYEHLVNIIPENVAIYHVQLDDGDRYASFDASK